MITRLIHHARKPVEVTFRFLWCYSTPSMSVMIEVLHQALNNFARNPGHGTYSYVREAFGMVVYCPSEYSAFVVRVPDSVIRQMRTLGK